MKIFFLRLLFILAIVFFEFSFFDVLFPQVSAPLIIIASIVAWTLLSDFPRVLSVILPLAALSDIVSSGEVGALTLYAVVLSYATSFLSRRLLMEHRGLGMASYALFTSGGVLGYVVFEVVLFRGSLFSWNTETLVQLFSSVSSAAFLVSFVSSPLLFVAMYRAIRRFDGYVGSLTQREVLTMK
ncbi:MAG: hypothetical protein WAW00_00540 [Candidatus Moraniibacteriota bacterium]